MLLPGLGSRCPIEFGNRHHEQINSLLLAFAAGAVPIGSQTPQTQPPQTGNESHPHLSAQRKHGHSSAAPGTLRGSEDQICRGRLQSNWQLSPRRPAAYAKRPTMAVQQWVMLGGLSGGRRSADERRGGLECALTHSTPGALLRLPRSNGVCRWAQVSMTYT